MKITSKIFLMLLLVLGTLLSQDFNEIQKILASDGAEDDIFGGSVCISGDYAIVGALNDDDYGSNSGSAYIFKNVAGNWTQIKKILPSEGADNVRFGLRVSISGNYAFVSTYEILGFEGTVYVFYKDEGGADNWGQKTKIVSTDSTDSGNFGNSICVYGDKLIVGARTYENRGAAYIFYKDEGGIDNWGEKAKLTLTDTIPGHFYGTSVKIDTDYAVVTAIADSSYHGAAFVYHKNEGGPDNWGEYAKLTATDGEDYDYFGSSASIWGNYIAIGADSDDDNGVHAGAVYIYKNIEGTWSQIKKILASDGIDHDNFGSSLSMSNEYIVVGAYANDYSKGKAYIFNRDEGGTDNWGEQAILYASDAAWGDYFGNSVSMTNDYILIAASADDDNGSDSGSIYIFDKPTSGIDIVTIPNNNELEQNYPNPFNPSTKISFSIPAKEFVSLKIYDAKGREIQTLVDGICTEGTHSFNFNAAKLSGGVYYYTLKVGNHSESKKMMLIK